MKSIFLSIACFVSLLCHSQQQISGTVKDQKNKPVMGANVYVEGTYDGATTAIDGAFNFTTGESGTVTLIVSFVGYEDYIQTGAVSTFKDVEIRFRESVNSLNSVILTAGSLEAGDSSKASTLKPLDIVTTAGAAGDLIGALQTLPGTTANPDDGRLFVRGGRGEEMQTFIDGNRVFSPFQPVTGNIPTRGRFSPFLFDGITFSTGGYSAEYGDALSSVLLLNTTDFPQEEKTEFQFMTVGAGAGRTEIWGDNSISANATYVNLAPYNEIIPQNNQFEDPFQSLSGELVYRHKTDDGIFKAYGAYSHSNFSIIQEDINLSDGFFIGIQNDNYYSNLDYKGTLGNGWKIDTGISLAHDRNEFTIADTQIKARETGLHAKLKLRKRYNNYFKINYGAEQFLVNYSENATTASGIFDTEVQPTNSGLFTEAELFLSKKVAFKAGLRGDYYGLSDQFKVSPRLSAAVTISEHLQTSVAYGQFFQQGQNNILQYSAQLAPQNADHYILNFLYRKNKRMLRAEAFYKSYDDLITFNTQRPEFNSEFTNDGNGYATGLDLFWRDETSVKNLDYWVSYSFLDTQRLDGNFPERARPNFAAKHNLSVVTKYWIDDLRSQVGMTYNYTSGRSFTNPNQSGFLNDQTGSFQSLDFNWAYLIDQQKILFFSVSNVLGRENIFGYQYSNTANAMGNFDRRAITQAADRFVFVGFFWTIGGNDNQLDNL